MFKRWIYLLAVGVYVYHAAAQKKLAGPIGVQFRTIDLDTSMLWKPNPDWQNKSVTYQVQTCLSGCENRSRWTTAETCHNASDTRCLLRDLSSNFSGRGRVRAILRSENSTMECTCKVCTCTKFTRTNVYSAVMNTKLSAPNVTTIEARTTSVILQIRLPNTKAICEFQEVSGTVQAVQMNDTLPDQCSTQFYENAAMLVPSTPFSFILDTSCYAAMPAKAVVVENLLENTNYCMYAQYIAFIHQSSVGYTHVVTKSDQADSRNILYIAVFVPVGLLLILIASFAVIRLCQKYFDYVYAEPPSFLDWKSEQEVDFKYSIGLMAQSEQTENFDAFEMMSPTIVTGSETKTRGDNKNEGEICQGSNHSNRSSTSGDLSSVSTERQDAHSIPPYLGGETLFRPLLDSTSCTGESFSGDCTPGAYLGKDDLINPESDSALLDPWNNN
uniref:Uncharacterized protein LOC104266598 n=1 Tax=Phallusia mammillata TaxID=59560 RepID=A0A6F9DJB2_9ASCI|nr:uncharacterized protein LOC104266598 [Phallusia mammillata]